MKRWNGKEMCTGTAAVGTLLFVLLFFMPLYGLISPLPAEAQVINLTYSGFMPPTHGQSRVEAAWCREVEKRTDGRVKIAHFPGQTLTKADQNYEGVVSGLSDIGSSVLQYTRGRFPLMDFINLPLGYQKERVACAIINEVYEKFQPTELSDVKLLYLHAHGPGFIHTKGKAVTKMDDLKGLKIRSHGPTAEMIKCLGGTPMAFPMTELYQSLQKGVVQGGLYPLESNKGWKMAEVTDYVIAAYDIAYSLGFFVAMNPKKWESLPEDIKKIIEEINSEWILKHAQSWEEDAFEGVAFLLKSGNSMIGIDPEEARRWRKAVQPVIDTYVKETGEKGLPGKEVYLYVEKRLKDGEGENFTSKYLLSK
jgi:TRAP-type transport system periplasmic protein